MTLRVPGITFLWCVSVYAGYGLLQVYLTARSPGLVFIFAWRHAMGFSKLPAEVFGVIESCATGNL